MSRQGLRTIATFVFIGGLVFTIANTWASMVSAILPLAIFGVGWFLILIDYLFNRKKKF